MRFLAQSEQKDVDNHYLEHDFCLFLFVLHFKSFKRLNAMSDNEKFLTLVSKEETITVERAKERFETRKYRELSNLIAFEILERLDQLGWKQKDLAAKMNVSAQQVSKWVKGREDFTLETLAFLSDVLGTPLIKVISTSSGKSSYVR